MWTNFFVCVFVCVKLICPELVIGYKYFYRECEYHAMKKQHFFRIKIVVFFPNFPI